MKRKTLITICVILALFTCGLIGNAILNKNSNKCVEKEASIPETTDSIPTVSYLNDSTVHINVSDSSCILIELETDDNGYHPIITANGCTIIEVDNEKIYVTTETDGASEYKYSDFFGRKIYCNPKINMNFN